MRLENHSQIRDSSDPATNSFMSALSWSEGFVGVSGVRIPDYRKLLRQKIECRQVIERRHELALREVAARAEDHHHTRIGIPSGLRVVVVHGRCLHVTVPLAEKDDWGAVKAFASALAYEMVVAAPSA